MDPKPCPECGRAVSAADYEPWSVTCDNCYDGAPDAGPVLHGWSYVGKRYAVEDWNAQVLEYLEEHAS